jgi:hypothetical protein
MLKVCFSNSLLHGWSCPEAYCSLNLAKGSTIVMEAVVSMSPSRRKHLDHPKFPKRHAPILNDDFSRMNSILGSLSSSHSNLSALLRPHGAHIYDTTFEPKGRLVA